MKRSGPLKRGKPLKRTAMKRKAPKPKAGRRTNLDRMARDLFRREAQFQRCCQSQDCGATGDWEAHHVVYEQHLRDIGEPIWDTENALRLCPDCHRRHHNRSKIIRLDRLSDRHIAYAFRKLGLRAYSYLTDRYAGEDQRVEQALATAEQEQRGDGDEPPGL